VRARDLVDTAHRNATDAIVELRDVTRSIHPPALDRGLDAALATLAARSGVPVSLRTDIMVRPSPAIETIAYFCAAELLTNATKHSGARRVMVDVTGGRACLRLRVSDDGTGGAHLAAGGGLAGLAERVRIVDGELVIASPAGGPTTVTVELPAGA
jgi:signal transduction histidine kinase